MRDAQAMAYVRTLVFAALLGVPVAFAAVLFQTAIHDVIHFVWEVVPDELGWSDWGTPETIERSFAAMGVVPPWRRPSEPRDRLIAPEAGL